MGSESSAFRDVVGGIAAPPDLLIPEFSIAELPEIEFEDEAFLDNCDASTNAVDTVRSREITAEGSPRRLSDLGVLVAIGVVIGLVVAVATHYLIPLLP